MRRLFGKEGMCIFWDSIKVVNGLLRNFQDMSTIKNWSLLDFGRLQAQTITMAYVSSIFFGFQLCSMLVFYRLSRWMDFQEFSVYVNKWM